MTYEYAVIILQAQDRALKKIKNIKIKKDGYEFRLNYQSGFIPYVIIEYREIGKRNFAWFSDADVCECRTAEEGIDAAIAEIDKTLAKMKKKK